MLHEEGQTEGPGRRTSQETETGQEPRQGSGREQDVVGLRGVLWGGEEETRPGSVAPPSFFLHVASSPFPAFQTARALVG